MKILSASVQEMIECWTITSIDTGTTHLESETIEKLTCQWTSHDRVSFDKIFKSKAM